jgi:hypothetical protein
LSLVAWGYTAGLGFGLGVGPGEVVVQNAGTVGAGVAVLYTAGHRVPTIPADGDSIGGLVIFKTPIWLLYRMLLGSPFANIGASASIAVAHGVAVAESEELRSVGIVSENLP